jgi:hypothetical protein
VTNTFYRLARHRRISPSDRPSRGEAASALGFALRARTRDTHESNSRKLDPISILAWRLGCEKPNKKLRSVERSCVIRLVGVCRDYARDDQVRILTFDPLQRGTLQLQEIFGPRGMHDFEDKLMPGSRL